MNIRWLGHSCFKITTAQGVRIVTDPYDSTVGYPMRPIEADVLTISHQHYDHNYRDGVGGNPVVFEAVGNFDFRSVHMDAYACYHDDEQGRKRGDNLIFRIEADGVVICHLGDIGHPLEESMLRTLGSVDVLMIPVGGIYTLDGAQAWELTRRMQPRCVVPMHYKTPPLTFSLAPVSDFLALAGAAGLAALPELELYAANLSQLPSIVVLDWSTR